MKTQETMQRVNELKNENIVLEEKVRTLQKELGFLKELFMTTASGATNDLSKLQGLDLQKLLSDDSSSSSAK